MNDKGNYEERYQSLLKDFQSLQEEYKTIKELRSDTMGAIELFKRLQTESSEREKVYRHQIAKLQSDKKNLHKDRTHLTKQLLSKHRDMIILNSEIEKFRDYDDYESRLDKANLLAIDKILIIFDYFIDRLVTPTQSNLSNL
jgi:chromosome segregation ATPase